LNDPPNSVIANCYRYSDNYLVPFRGLSLSDNCFSCWLPKKFQRFTQSYFKIKIDTSHYINEK